MCDKVQRTVLEVLFDPDGGVFQPAPHLAGIGTVSVSCEGVVEPTSFYNDLDGRIVRPRQTPCKMLTPMGCKYSYHSSPKKPAMKYSADFSIRS